MTNAVLTRQAPKTLDADAARFLTYLHRGGIKSYYTTFDKAGNAHTAWYDSTEPPPPVPTGTNVYFGVNPCTAIPTTNKAGKPTEAKYVRARVEYVAALNCLYAEFDAKDFGNSLDVTLAHVRSLAVPPSVIVASGGGYHCYWLLVEPFVLDSDEARQLAVDAQRDFVTFVRGDKNAKDLPRVLRVPGTLNYKYDEPRPVAFVEQDYSRLYTLDALRAMLPPKAPRKTRIPKQNAPACHTDGLEANVAQSVDFMVVSKAAAALAQLSTERRDEYTGWLNVGMALRELDEIGYELWDAWSMPSPKYEVGECRDKWRTFHAARTDSDKDIPLDALYRWAKDDAGEFKHETGSTLDANERRQLQEYKARDIQQQAILNMDAPLSAKAIIVGMLPVVEAARKLVENKDGHTGNVAITYGHFADIFKTSDSTVLRAIDIGEKANLWRKDAEYKETNVGYERKVVSLDLQPAFYNAKLAQPIEQKPRGGARPGAGRKPKCPKHPKAAVREEVTTVTIQYCAECNEILHHSTEQVTRTLVDETPAAGEFKHETGTPPLAVETNAEPMYAETVDAPLDADTRQRETSDEFKHETVYTDGTTTVSCLNSAPAVDDTLADTYDMVTAIRLANTYAPANEHGRREFQTAMYWLQRGEHEKAAALAPKVLNERARGALLHLAARTPQATAAAALTALE